MARVQIHLELKSNRDRLKNHNLWLEQEVQKRTRENQKILDVTIGVVSQLVETRDEDSGHHIARTKAYYEIIARHLQQLPQYRTTFTDKHVDRITKASPLHDIGKIGVLDSILLKPGKLTPEEFETMKTHTLIGGNALRKAIKITEMDLTKEGTIDEARHFFDEAINIAEYHHERWDGTGYPHGLAGEDIPVSARIMALVDVFDALTNDRVYKPAWSFEETVMYIQSKSGTQFDPTLVEVFNAQLDQFRTICITQSNK